MKTSNYILFAIIIAFVLSSCSSLSITQKRYSRGLNIDWFSGKDEKGVAKVKKVREKNAIVEQKAETTNSDVAVAEEKMTPTETEVIDPNMEVPAMAKTSTSDLPTLSKRKINKVKSVLKHASIAQPKSKETLRAADQRIPANSPSSTNEGDVSTILLVILCLLPPLGLLAVYLHQGEINETFWITLVLYLLFLLPGIIYSLLVVLDVI